MSKIINRRKYLAGFHSILLGALTLNPMVGMANEASDQELELDEIIVTGSRLARSAMEAPTPLILLNREDIDIRGATNIADILNELPAFGIPAASPLTTNTSDVGIGQNLIDLRNLGVSRTLVLVNGRRHVAGRAGTSAVDINAIPADFVERVEVITGGASAVYGSEAIAGVVNIITKKNFEGFHVNAQSGITQEGDGQNNYLSVTYGTLFNDGKGQFMINASYSHSGTVLSKNRENSKVDKFQNADGTIRSPAGSGVVLDSLLLYPTNTGGFNVITMGSDGLFNKPLSTEDRYNRIADRQVLMPLERKLLSGIFNYEISDSLSFFAEATYSDTSAKGLSEPIAIGSFWPFGARGENENLLNLPISNPYIPAEVLNTIDPNATSIRFFARPARLGGRSHPVDRSSIRVATGFEGELEGGWNWDFYMQYGESKEHQETNNLVNLRKFVEAINAEVGPGGEIRCISEIARAEGCVPYNIFGRNAASQASLDYIRGSATYNSKITQKVVAASITGSPLSLSAGDVLLAAGVEYREEESAFRVDSLTRDGVLTFAQTRDTVGEYNVVEGFSEVSIPIVSDFGVISSANIDAAARFAKYSTIGTTFSWKAGMNVELSGGVRFRGTYSEATRAPNIGELFLPRVGDAGRVSDPCAGGGNVSGLSADAAARRVANCTALGIDSSFVPDQLALESVFGLTGGNPDLNEEKARTFTVGAVYSPEYIQGLVLMVDYWKISVNDAIGSISRQLTVNQCVDQPSINNQFCANMVRDFQTLQIREINTTIQNLANQKVSGIDFTANYDFAVHEEDTLGLSLLGTVLMKDELQQFSGAEVQNRIGEIAHPKWKATGRITYKSGPLVVSWTTRYIGSALKDKSVSSEANKIGAFLYSNAQVRYQFSGVIEAYFGVDNVFNKQAPIVASPHPLATISSQTAASVYDPIGRRFYLGMNLNF